MATTLAKFFKDEHIELRGKTMPLGTSKTEGELVENSGLVQDGLVGHYELDDTLIGTLPDQNLLDDSVWTVGTSGSQGNFSQNGETAANTRILKETPWGYEDVVWATEVNDSTSDADGGWTNYNNAIDNTKTYRLSVWIRRENVGNGRTYFGTQGNTVWNLGTTTTNGNPYFGSRLITDIPEQENNWLLWVGHIHPYTYGGGTHQDSGIFSMDGIKVSSLTDYQWTSTASQGGHRSYLYYSTSVNERQYWYDPRMEVVDDYTSSIPDILKQLYDLKHPVTTTNIRPNIYGAGIKNTTTNEVLNPTGNEGAGEPGSYTPGWDTTLHPKAFTVSNWSGGYNSGVPSVSTGYHAQWVREGPDASPCMKFIDRNDLFGLGHRWLGISQQVSSNVDTSWGLVSGLKTITMSWDQRVDDLGKPIRAGFYHSEGGSNTFGNSETYHYNTVINQWERMTKTYTVNSNWDAGTFMNIYFYGFYGDYGTIWIDNVQLEIDKDYDNVFVESTGGLPLFQIQNPVNKGGNFTVNFWAKILPSIGTSGSYLTLFCMGDYYSNNSFTIMERGNATVTGEQQLIRRGDAGQWSWANNAFNDTSNYYGWNMYTVVRGSTNYDCYYNGVYKATVEHLSTTMQDFVYLGSRNGGSNSLSSYIKKLSFYDKALSTDEIQTLYGGMSMKSNGDLIVETLTIPEINVWADPDMTTTTYQVHSGPAVTLEQDASGGMYHQVIATNTGSVYNGYDITDNPRTGLVYRGGLVAGETYIVSGYFWASAGNTLTNRTLAVEQAASVSVYGMAWSSLPEETWTYSYAEFVADASVRILIYPCSSAGGSGTAKWRNISVQKKLGKPVKINKTRDIYTRDLVEE